MHSHNVLTELMVGLTTGGLVARFSMATEAGRLLWYVVLTLPTDDEVRSWGVSPPADGS